MPRPIPVQFSAYWRYAITCLLAALALLARPADAAPQADPRCPGARPIAEARMLAPGAEVTVRGIVTVPTGALSADRSFALQDMTGGMYVFRQAGIAQVLVIGDEVCVTGQLAVYHRLLELVPRAAAQIVRLGHGAPPAAQSVRPGEVGKANEGRLITITGTISDLAERRFRVDGASVYVYATTGVSLGSLRAGCPVSVTGYSGNYDGPQVWPRMQADIVPGSCEAGIGTPAPTAPTCPDAHVWQLQGSGDATPFDTDARFRCLEACVTGVTATGFFVQSLTPDTDPRTSEGIYVYRFPDWSNPRGLAPGLQVELRGFGVQEFYGQTEIVKLPNDTEAAYRVTGACEAPAAIPVIGLNDPAADSVAHFEPFEGMRVSISFEGSVVGPTQRYNSRYPAGDPEITLALRGSPFFGQRILADELPAERGTLSVSGALGVDLPDVGTYDRVTAEDLTGILAYQFGRYVLLVEDPAPLRVKDVPDVGGAVAAISPDEFALCTYNVENLFDSAYDGDGDVGDWSPTDEAAFLAAVAADARVIRKALQGCTVVGLQEMEGKDAVWEQLARAVGPSYRYDYFESADVRDITVGVLYDAAHVTLRRAEQPQNCGPVDYQVQYRHAIGPRSRPNPCPAGTYPVFDRPPYLADLAVHDAMGKRALDVRVIVVHLKSKRGDEAENLPRRAAQARFVNTLLTEPLSVALGDFNDRLSSQPLALFPGRVNLLTRYVAPAERYTFIYQGRGEAIDHFIMTPALERYFLAGGPVRVNADFPKRLVAGRSSDHDPLFVRFAFRPTGVRDALLGAVTGAVRK